MLLTTVRGRLADLNMAWKTSSGWCPVAARIAAETRAAKISAATGATMPSSTERPDSRRITARLLPLSRDASGLPLAGWARARCALASCALASCALAGTGHRRAELLGADLARGVA